jgi:hypothetical protein
MPEYEFGVQWRGTREVIYAGAEDHCRTVHDSLTKIATNAPRLGTPILVRRPKGDWEEVQ